MAHDHHSQTNGDLINGVHVGGGSRSISGSTGGTSVGRRGSTEDAAGEEFNSVGFSASSPARKKQKRNKPTLSCEECVERKTKCDRTRPNCLACVKRQSRCKYSDVANVIAASDTTTGTPTTKSKRSKPSISSSTFTGATKSPGLPSPVSYHRSTSSSSSTSSPFLLSNVQHTRQVPGSVFGSGSSHPFANYWTTTGGIAEVVGVLPSKEQADSLVAKYFESVDPVYPMVHHARFQREYDTFWALSQADRGKADASMLALHFAIYAMGAQFIQMESEQARAQIAEFYVSAAHQSLRLYPFLSRTSVRSIQAMVLMSYFLMNDNKATDAWAFGGLLVRQAYAMGLNRDPNLMVPNGSPIEKQQRRKVWQAVYFQDTFLTVILKLPPTTTFSDVTVESLTEDPAEDPSLIASTPSALSQPISSNPMSISNIAPRQPSPPHTPLSARHSSRHNDVDFIRSMWRMADLVQSAVCIPRALGRPLTNSPRQKATLISQFRVLYASFPTSLTATSRSAFASLVASDGRLARQNLFLRSNFWHCLMVLEADENEPAGVRCDVRGALEAGRLALGSFLDFWDGLRVDAGVWWVFQHRAFEEALTMAQLLAAYQPVLQPLSASPGVSEQPPMVETLFAEAKEDVNKMLEVLEHVGSAAPEMQKTRTDVLRKAFEAIHW
ncbi:hypothetical protein EJ08DRAFT_645819 [Tothia fuscella]|uniref:Zn(2)-C6 fungal-type domain-containing protein n=1 Tax=Tothia fuscella TaxID=1048955 RepID=A0A9P4P1G8_9PEZI|nr:hypothetical protein EJ08DRAFT_645819 [Tothia fuscella]